MPGKIIVLKGLPGCGKSTYAKTLIEENPKAIRLNKDTLRDMLHFGGFNPRNERYIVETEYQLAEKFLAKEMTVIIDDTNLNELHVAFYKTLTDEYGAEFELVEFDTSLEDCIIRDIQRQKNGERFVGADKIINMAHKFKYLKQERQMVVFDMDGTLTNLDHRRPIVMDVPEGEKPDWDKFFSQCDKDTVRPDIMDRLRAAYLSGMEVVICSARPEEYREMTERWLELNGAWTEVNGQKVPMYTRLIMRKRKDYRKDNIVKKEMLDHYLDKTKIVKWYDDRPVVIRMLQENGVNVEDVGTGEEF
jgi:predicted kinase